jgi:hypothetical protein
MTFLLVLLTFNINTGDPIDVSHLRSFDTAEECEAAIQPGAFVAFDGKAYLPVCLTPEGAPGTAIKPQGDSVRAE